MTLDEVLCLLHLSIMGKLLDNGRITKDEALEILVDYLKDDPTEENKELDRTRGYHARFEYLKKVYTEEL